MKQRTINFLAIISTLFLLLLSFYQLNGLAIIGFLSVLFYQLSEFKK